MERFCKDERGADNGGLRGYVVDCSCLAPAERSIGSQGHAEIVMACEPWPTAILESSAMSLNCAVLSPFLHHAE